MVSTTSVERPEAMSCAPSGATPTVSTTPDGGERTNPLPEIEEIPPDWNLPCRDLFQNSRKESNRGGRHTDKASATSVPWNQMELDESERTRRDIVRSLEKQTSPPGLDQTSSKSSPSPLCGASIPPGLSSCLNSISAS